MTMSMVSGLAAAEGGSPAQAAPSRRLQIANFVVFQLAWFAAVLGAAHGLPVWGTAAIAAAIAWHLSQAARPAVEARLIGIVSVIGFVVEWASALQGHIAYPSGQPIAWLPPYWMVALWALLAIALNVTLRWLKGKPWLAAVIGAVAGPAAFVSGVRLGGATFIDTVPALITMACTWGVLMPTLMWLSDRYDGIATPRASTTGPSHE